MRQTAEQSSSKPLAGLRLAAAALLWLPAGYVGSASASPATAIQQNESAPSQKRDTGVLQAFEGTLPPPSPMIDRSGTPGVQAAPAKPVDPSAATALPDGSDAPAEIIRDMSTLPAPIKRMREQLVEAAASGDVERLRALVGTGANRTQIMGTDSDDPIDTVKGFSGDPDGQEILAILIDILSTGAARFDAGKPDEVYVWPYFTGKTLASLTPPERVDLLRIVTAGDLIGMEESGNYNFYRVGITPDGQWKFLAGGD
ncbi:hypothetical protein E2F50_09680 [Rhizobium deserti]|uniref:Uncharacterized protein n=1 Tax=Rhizobium deserti TaxID=2547961 RepID=A0A4R5UK24_9HYPH|nr:hypothetical protein [Rhizobium deserti]TDK37154.1 hypothetical protein E2F50_09680 [Rhizobium deserti]